VLKPSELETVTVKSVPNAFKHTAVTSFEVAIFTVHPQFSLSLHTRGSQTLLINLNLKYSTELIQLDRYFLSLIHFERLHGTSHRLTTAACCTRRLPTSHSGTLQ
jgi:hypothetical protein